MPPLKYHAGQIAIQEEASTRIVADKLARWVGPVEEFALGADLILLATTGEGGRLSFATLSGTAPLAEVVGPHRLRLPLPASMLPAGASAAGGLVMNLGQARRARINGALTMIDGAVELEGTETFTLCRKYMAPSLAIEGEFRAGPGAREPLAPADPWIAGVLARAETSFLASVSPEGGPDIAHRGGPPGFIEYDTGAGRLTWPEYLGDGVFKSAGNVRATGTLTLLVIDLDSGDGVALSGRGEYTNIRSERRQRLDPLIQHREPFPLQGTMVCTVDYIERLRGITHPRRRIERAVKVTSCSTVDEQAPR